MSRIQLPFAALDVSALARALGRELEACEGKPGHVQLLNMLVRSVGYRNFQHFRANHVAEARLASPPAPPEPVDLKRVEHAAKHFDAAGRLARWPAKESRRSLALWVLWSRIPAGATFTEAQFNALLRAGHLFDDPALLRRGMVDGGLAWRTTDGRSYRRIEQRPPEEALALIRHLGRELN
ncbi:DUF2087 domain-containing protein [Xanthobacter dioxanivorans]|uniref:DUF2087 domain-containing protein n=1 Tax=Xanthobacter dioxanivorans TaxID=2528964 RepID=A0A974SIN4_9HYPH|nr:DUF2087 domain-containing protein [Xanthobacter dioxanivorans]QRG05528.1 DUF2087 domain-containing protein [Xanthobacter dioxanivorans]